MSSIKWTRGDVPGLYVSRCGQYEIARKWNGTAEYDATWVPYYKGSDNLWRRLAGRDGCRLLAQARRVCSDHAAAQREAVTA